MLEKMRVMVVDDNTVNLATVEQALMEKYEVVPMISGRRAVKYLYRDKVDLILLDVQMPIMDGIDTLREIRTQPNGTTVPVIFLTSRTDKNTVLEGSKLGIMDYITKPFEPDDLQKRIERVFKRLGKLPMEEDELIFRLKEILSDINNGRDKGAVYKMDEVLGYQIDIEVSGRIKNAKMKLEKGMTEPAANMMDRVIRLLEKSNSSAAGRTVAAPISAGEINARLLYILDDLVNFKIKEASVKVIDIQKHDLPEDIANELFKVKTHLDEFDDEEAERLIRDLLDRLKRPSSNGIKEVMSPSKEDVDNGTGYHFNRLF
ncbi:MAG: response regulator transcription factor [Lachnospiraceae bacterium]|nr:response regulator transcription factor [Lachnospiraceae bacterium]